MSEAVVYVAVTEAGCEKRAMQWLLEHDVAAYTPMRRFWRHANGKRYPNERPVPGFERYVFVASALAPRAVFAEVMACRFVSGMLGVEDRPVPIDAPVMGCKLGVARQSATERLSWYWLCDCFGLFDSTRGRKPKMTVGQLVRIIGGPFQGYQGEVSVLLSDKRLTVITRGRAGGKLNVPREHVEAISEGAKAA